MTTLKPCPMPDCTKDVAHWHNAGSVRACPDQRDGLECEYPGPHVISDGEDVGCYAPRVQPAPDLSPERRTLADELRRMYDMARHGTPGLHAVYSYGYDRGRADATKLFADACDWSHHPSDDPEALVAYVSGLHRGTVDVDCGHALPPEPQPIDPADIRPGMRVRRVHEWRGVTQVREGLVKGIDSVTVTTPDDGVIGYSADPGSWFLLADAPDPDEALVERMARAAFHVEFPEYDWGDYDGDEGAECRAELRAEARAALAALREVADVTPRADQ